ncbi:MAG: hypothetical protein LBI61_02800 [Puniceicoccales bacterium]|nr:hypothetical protein [Puniceicoccales bacterium]
MAIARNVTRKSRNAREKIPTKKGISQNEAPAKDEMTEIGRAHAPENSGNTELGDGGSFILNAADSSRDLLAKARALAVEERVSLPKYLAAMLWHAIRGHDLANIHFFQDGSGDSYDSEVIRKMCEQAREESARGECLVFETDDECRNYFKEIRRKHGICD